MKGEFNQKETLKKIDEYLNRQFEITEPVPKIFYHYTEWEGWRFYRKALRHGDFRSIWWHIKSKFQ